MARDGHACGAEGGDGERKVMGWTGKDRAARASVPDVCVRGGSNGE